MNKPSIIFRLHRALLFLLKGVGKKETEHYLFMLEKPLSDVALYRILANHHWHPNYMGYVYKDQVYQCRYMIEDSLGKYQCHVRFYKNGKVTGHWEISPEHDASDHLSGVDLRTMNAAEALWLKGVLKQ